MTQALEIRRGTEQVGSKLTVDQAQAILDADGDVSNSELAECYGVNESTVHAIRTRRRWSHLTPSDKHRLSFIAHREQQQQRIKQSALEQHDPNNWETQVGVDLFGELERFDNQRWSVACREMQVRVIHGNIAAAHAVLDAFCRHGNYTQATMASHVIAVFPLRLANALEENGYMTVAAVDRATVSELLAIPNVGEKTITEAREIIKRVKAGKAFEHSDSDADLLDESCFIARLEDVIGVMTATRRESQGLNEAKNERNAWNEMDNATQVLEALRVIASSPDTTVDVIDQQIDGLTKQVNELKRLRKLVAGSGSGGNGSGGGDGGSRNIGRELTPAQSAIEAKAVEYIKRHGKSKPSVIADAIKCTYVQVGQVAARSKVLVKRGALVELAS